MQIVRFIATVLVSRLARRDCGRQAMIARSGGCSLTLVIPYVASGFSLKIHALGSLPPKGGSHTLGLKREATRWANRYRVSGGFRGLSPDQAFIRSKYVRPGSL